MLVKEAARIAAEETLQQFWPGGFPIDPVQIAQTKGLEVRFAALRDGVSGAIIAEAGTKPVVLVDASESVGRQRFTIAHEIGHYCEREAADDHEFSFVETRTRAYSLHELYADTYAANLLMPEREFRKVYSRQGGEFEAAAFFAVSPSAVEMRAEKLGLA